MLLKSLHKTLNRVIEENKFKYKSFEVNTLDNTNYIHYENDISIEILFQGRDVKLILWTADSDIINVKVLSDIIEADYIEELEYDIYSILSEVEKFYQSNICLMPILI